MATVAVNNIVRTISLKSLFEDAFPLLTTSVNYNQGDLITFDATNKVLKAVTGDNDAANLLGVARQTIVSGIPQSPYTTLVTPAIEAIAGPAYGVVCSFILKTGDAFNPGDKVYLTTTNAQTITSSNPGSGKEIGMFQGIAVASAAALQTGNVLVGARYNLPGIEY